MENHIEAAGFTDTKPVSAMFALTIMITIVCAAYVYLGSILAWTIAGCAVAAAAAWIKSTFEEPAEFKAFMPFFLVSAAAQMMMHFEEVYFGFPSAFSIAFSGTFSPTVVFCEFSYVLGIPLLGMSLFGMTAVGIFYRQRLANYFALFAYLWAIAYGASHFVYPFFSPDGYGYLPGMAFAVVAMAVSIKGVRQIFKHTTRGG